MRLGGLVVAHAGGIFLPRATRADTVYLSSLLAERYLQIIEKAWYSSRVAVLCHAPSSPEL